MSQVKLTKLDETTGSGGSSHNNGSKESKALNTTQPEAGGGPVVGLESQKKKRAKPLLHSNSPARPLSGYNMFFREERVKWLQERAEQKANSSSSSNEDPDSTNNEAEQNKGQKGSSLFRMMGREIGRRWKNLDPEMKAQYEAAAKVDQDRYRAEKKSAASILRKRKQQQQQQQQQRQSSKAYETKPAGKISSATTMQTATKNQKHQEQQANGKRRWASKEAEDQSTSARTIDNTNITLHSPADVFSPSQNSSGSQKRIKMDSSEAFAGASYSSSSTNQTGGGGVAAMRAPFFSAPRAGGSGSNLAQHPALNATDDASPLSLFFQKRAVASAANADSLQSNSAAAAAAAPVTALGSPFESEIRQILRHSRLDFEHSGGANHEQQQHQDIVSSLLQQRIQQAQSDQWVEELLRQLFPSSSLSSAGGGAAMSRANRVSHMMAQGNHDMDLAALLSHFSAPSFTGDANGNNPLVAAAHHSPAMAPPFNSSQLHYQAVADLLMQQQQQRQEPLTGHRFNTADLLQQILNQGAMPQQEEQLQLLAQALEDLRRRLGFLGADININNTATPSHPTNRDSACVSAASSTQEPDGLLLDLLRMLNNHR